MIVAGTAGNIPDTWTADSLTTYDECYECIRTLGSHEQFYRASYYWVIGAVVERIGQLGSEEPEATTSKETGFKPRHLRYCRATASAFTLAEVQKLTRARMQWSTLRELSSEILAPYRKQLCDDFLAGKLTDIEIRDQAQETRTRLLEEARTNDEQANEDKAGDDENSDRDDTVDPDVSKCLRLLKELSAALASTLTKGVEVCDAFSGELRTNIADVLIDEQGELNQKMVSELVELEKPLIRQAIAAVSVCNTCRIIRGSSEYAFDALDEVLKEARDIAD